MDEIVEHEIVKCCRIVKCWDYLLRTCVRPWGHQGGCNPFNDTEPLPPPTTATIASNSHKTNLITAVDLLRKYQKEHDFRHSSGDCPCDLCDGAKQLISIVPTRGITV